MTEIQGKSILVRVSARFELSMVRATEGKITVNVRGNPGEFDFGSSYRESTVSRNLTHKN